MKFQRPRKYNPMVQVFSMKSHYPNFKCKKLGKNNFVFTGEIQPHPNIQAYTIEITYRGGIDPKVMILNPDIDENNPHYYKKSRSLCLYKPDLFEWKRHYLVSKYIVRWTSAWIYFYEVWLQTGKWYGPEAPHNRPKIQ